MQTAAEMSLTGPTGQVYALAVASELLFAATQVSFRIFGLPLLCLETSNSSFIRFSFFVLCAGREDFSMEI
jgi:hypothetical protein